MTTPGTPLVSVIVPTRDRPHFARQAVRMAEAQTGVALEVIVVDDGSAIPLVLPPAPTVRALRHDEPRGLAASRNHGIAHARGEWIAFLDEGDAWAPDKLRRQLDQLTAAGAQWGCTGVVWLDPDGGQRRLTAPAGAWVGHADLTEGNVVGPAAAVLVRSELLQALGGFDPMYCAFADWDLWLRLTYRADALVDRLPLTARLTAGTPVHRAHVRQVLLELRRLELRHAAGFVRARGDALRWLQESTDGRRIPQLVALAVQAGRNGDLRSAAAIAIGSLRRGAASAQAPSWATPIEAGP